MSSSHLLYFPFSFTDTPPTDIYPLSLHDALPISPSSRIGMPMAAMNPFGDAHSGGAKYPACEKRGPRSARAAPEPFSTRKRTARSEEHTSELQSRSDLVCRLLLEKKKKKQKKTD